MHARDPGAETRPWTRLTASSVRTGDGRRYAALSGLLTLRGSKTLGSRFDACPTVFMDSSKDAAEIAYGLMIGLRSAVYFDANIDLPEAHRLFLSTMLTMGGLS